MIAKRNATKGRKLRRSSLAQFFSVFGTPLKKVLLRENRQTHGVPIVVEKCVAAIRAQGLDSLSLSLQPFTGFEHEGIFRLSGDLAIVEKLKREFNSGIRKYNLRVGLILTGRGTDMDLTKVEIKVITTLLGKYLRELPEPLFPFELYPALMDTFGIGLGLTLALSRLTSMQSLEQLVLVRTSLLKISELSFEIFSVQAL